ncbi:MAG: Fe-S cluster assembly protein HesB [Oscillochloris sp.]|nr:Fe-S cluster assembly protein HesB [Oscillochloris sp.]
MVSLRNLYAILRTHFGPLHGSNTRLPWWPLFGRDPPFEIIVGAVLVQQTRWETVEAAVLRLLATDMLSPAALTVAHPEALAAIIRPVAFHSQKALGLIAIVHHIGLHYDGSTAGMLARPTADLRAELLALPRIGPETCDVIMLYAGGHPVFVVDAYTRRLFERVDPEIGGEMPGAKDKRLWQAPYEQLRLAIESELSDPALGLGPPAPVFSDLHAQINEVCVRYCLSRPRCDGPPARRIYSVQANRESYLTSNTGCPLRSVCAWYQHTKNSKAG